MDTHPRSAKDAEDTRGQIASGDLPTLVRTIDPILLRLIEGVQKGTVGTVELVDIAVRIRTILHDAVRAASDGDPVRHSAAQVSAGGARDGGEARAVQ
ncbi:MAG: hypothetical protein GX652_06650 [Burkholderiaceae bacterium]|nr:hypothetical protein [Burkholderiaceae bacterium]